MKWVFRHAAFLLTRYEVGHDGLTPLRRLTGSNWTGSVYEIGGMVLGKLALKKPSNNKEVKRGEKKLVERSVLGVWLGVVSTTGEHIIAKADGEAIRVRTVHPVPEGDQWDASAVLAVKALPRRPSPSTVAATFL